MHRDLCTAEENAVTCVNLMHDAVNMPNVLTRWSAYTDSHHKMLCNKELLTWHLHSPLPCLHLCLHWRNHQAG